MRPHTTLSLIHSVTLHDEGSLAFAALDAYKPFPLPLAVEVLAVSSPRQGYIRITSRASMFIPPWISSIRASSSSAVVALPFPRPSQTTPALSILNSESKPAGQRSHGRVSES